MNRISKFFSKIRYSYRSLPGKKQYIEFFTALLTVPVLLTVIIINLSNLQEKDKPKEEAGVNPIVITTAPNTNNNNAPITPAATTAPCIEEIGPISIASPQENEKVQDNPLSIEINYTSKGYCAVVWAYKINNGRLSDYGSNNIVIYNPPQGTIRFELRVKSLVTGEEEILQRTFTYEGSSSIPTPTPTPTETPQASGSAN